MDDVFDQARIKVARDLARKLLEDAGLKTYPVKLKDVARFVPDLYIDGQEMEDEISGIQATYKGKSFIRYNSAHPTVRNRFTLAHELGHLLLGHTSQCQKSTFASTNYLEVEANQFAAELLCPLNMLKKAVGTITTVDRLATAFWVSKDCMNWRVMETRLYNKLTSWH